MNEYTKKVIVGILVAIIFCVCIALVVIGQRNVGLQGLLIELIGLAGLVALLWLYNRQYR
ncbi:MAG: hypothetical protein MR308_10475 [Lachnospiraceae bacterium]|nr:hypothetical protein [Lachnospiraceae bacterium]